MKKSVLLFLVFFASLSLTVFAQNHYVENRLILKLKKNCTTDDLSATINKKGTSLGQISFSKVFPSKSEKLKNIYFMNYSSPVNPQSAKYRLLKTECVEWVEPDFIGKLAGIVPNDNRYDEQWYLKKIGMEEAWEIQQGNGEITIAVIDNGLDIGHDDLFNQIWINPNETNNDGIDNDGNGYIDDYYGWDFGNGDGGIEHDGVSFHGTQVAGLIGATTNNSIGIASVGFNVKIMGLKITDSSSDTEVIMSAGYRALIYAVDMGASVINCSWGNYSYSHLGEEAVNYAREHNVVIVGAAGNDGVNEIFYPARYKNVLAVGATDSSNAVWNASNYGYYLDLTAPGKDIISTGANNFYETASGTSLSTPLVSGVAALVMLHFPELTSGQISERIRVSSYNNYPENPGSLQYLLGFGRLNANEALTNQTLKSVRSITYTFSDGNDNIFQPGENVNFVLQFENILNALNNLQVTLATNDPFLEIIQNSFSASAVSSGEIFSNSDSPFVFKVKSNVPENHKAFLRLDFSDGNYSDFQWYEVLLNPTYSDMSVNKLRLTITSKGSLGFEDYPYNTKGNGLTYENDGKIRFFEAGFLYGTSETQVMDALHIEQFATVSNDFQTVKPFSAVVPGEEADQQGLLVFNDNNAGENKLNIETKLISYAFSDEENQNYVILRYILKNNGSTEINNLYAGLFFDWDLDEDDYGDDIVNYNSQYNFGYAYDDGFNTISTYHAVSLISDNNYNFWANSNDGNNGGINLEQFTDDKKWTMLSSGLNHVSSGPTDISFVISGGPYSVAANDSVNVAFAVAVAPTMDELILSITNARIKYAALPSEVTLNEDHALHFSLSQNYPNPFNPTTTIKYSIPSVIASASALSGEQSNSSNSTQNIQFAANSTNVQLIVYDILGREIATLVNKRQTAGNYTVQFDASALPSGIYFYTLRAGNFVATKKMILLK